MNRGANPFGQFRAENSGDDLWKLFVPGPFTNLFGSRPVVVEGGRGCGKTTLFLCNSWHQQLLSQGEDLKAIQQMLSPQGGVGLYYKVDSAFVSSMTESRKANWAPIFSTYLAACLIRECLGFLRVVREVASVDMHSLLPALSVCSDLLPDRPRVDTIESAVALCESVLDQIEDGINSPSADVRVRGTAMGRPLRRFVEQLRTLPLFSASVFRVFVDEYETLLQYQQRLINTLIKQTSSYLIYNIGMRPHGMLSSQTYSSTEIIQDPHDFKRVRPEFVFNQEDNVGGGKQYADLLSKIARRRLELKAAELGQAPIPTDIEFYLGKYRLEDEVAAITSSGRTPVFMRRLERVIGEFEPDPRKAAAYYAILGTDAPKLNARLHLAILMRTARYRPSLERLATVYRQFKTGERGEYDQWLHNAKLGLVFLMCREYRVPKTYFGFDVFVLLSSGIIRYFLELCEQAFESATLKGFDWAKPRQIMAEEQSVAARYVSRYKIRDIVSYEPHGRELRIFVENLGSLFGHLHSHPNITLGEPEPNHFSTNDLALDEGVSRRLKSAVMWAVMQDRGPTKIKSSMGAESLDYHLNHIYAPYFDISYRQKRKISISPDELGALLSGDQVASRSVARRLAFRLVPRKPVRHAHLCKPSQQLSIWDGDRAEDEAGV